MLTGSPAPPYGQLLSLLPRIELAKLADHIERHDTDLRDVPYPKRACQPHQGCKDINVG